MPGTNSRALTEKLALDLLARDGIAVIWQLHLAAARAYQYGAIKGAKTLIDIADAAEQCLQHAGVAARWGDRAITVIGG